MLIIYILEKRKISLATFLYIYTTNLILRHLLRYVYTLANILYLYYNLYYLLLIKNVKNQDPLVFTFIFLS